MFNFSDWVTSGIINGYKTGEMSFAKTTELTANYLAKGIITQEQADKVMSECPVPTYEEASTIEEVELTEEEG